MKLNLQKWIAGLALLGVCLASALTAVAKDAPKPKAPPSDWRKYIFEDIKAPTPRPKETQAESRPTRVGGLSGSAAPVAKDAPPPTAPPTTWGPPCFGDYKPTPRPKETQTESRPKLPGVGSLSGTRGPMAKDKDAPPPTAPPTVQLKYVTEDYKPTPRPKENQTESRPVLPGVGSLSGSRVPMAKDAPPPTAPPTVWLKYIGEDIKAPQPAPKETQKLSRPKLPGASSLSGAMPSATPFPPKRPPYVHPRDLKDFTGDIRKDVQGPPPPR